MLSTARLTMALAITSLVFAARPALDLTVSGWFHAPGAGFGLAASPVIEALRRAIWTAGLLLLAGLVFMAMRAAVTGARGGVWLRGAGALLIGPGLIMNGLFKAHWGRARPRDIAEFGGSAQFTPPVQISDQCAANCSFMSGEGSLAIMAALVCWGLFAPLLAGRQRRLLGIALIAFALTGAGLRIAMGAHFLSDTLFAALICGYVWAALRPEPARIDQAEMRRQLAAIARPLRQKLAETPGRFSALMRSRNS